MHSPLTNYVLAEKWAKCYRHFHHGDTDTNMYLERYKSACSPLHHLELFLSFSVFITSLRLFNKCNRYQDASPASDLIVLLAGRSLKWCVVFSPAPLPDFNYYQLSVISPFGGNRWKPLSPHPVLSQQE